MLARYSFFHHHSIIKFNIRVSLEQIENERYWMLFSRRNNICEGYAIELIMNQNAILESVINILLSAYNELNT